MKKMRRPQWAQWKATVRDKVRIQVDEHGCAVWHSRGVRGGKMRLRKWTVAES